MKTELGLKKVIVRRLGLRDRLRTIRERNGFECAEVLQDN